MPSKEYYTYLHCKPDGTPFYVGKGSGRRAYQIHRDRNRYHANVVKKYGKENILVYIFPCESEERAYADEVLQIASLRLQGCELCNLNAGGEGGSSPVSSVREKMAAKAFETWANQDVREKRQAAVKAAMNKPEVRAATSKRMKGVKKSPEHTEKNRIARTGKKLSLETRAKQSEGIKAALARPEIRAKMGPKNPSRYMAGKCHSDETKRRMSVSRTGKAHPSKRSPSIEQTAMMKELRATGLSYAKIAIAVGSNSGTVYENLTKRRKS
jgi:hypothetical protein